MLTLAALAVALAQDAPPRFVLSLGHPGALVITGADTVGANVVERALLRDPDFFEASMPVQRLSSYVGWLELAVTSAYQNAGFALARVAVRVDDEATEVRVEVVEGPVFLADDLVLEGATHLDVGRLRDVLRAGSLERASLDALESGRTAAPSFWVPGEPAPVSALDRERLERLAASAVEAAGFLSAEARLRWEPGDGNIVRPVLVVAREGPRSFVRDLRFEGAAPESEARLRAWAAAEGEIASLETRRGVEARLRATGRFLDVRTRYERDPAGASEVVLAVDVVPNPVAPPLAEHPAERLASLVSGLERLSRLSGESHAEPVGLKLALDLRPAALAGFYGWLADLGVDLGDGEGASYRVKAAVVQRAAVFELERIAEDAAPEPLVRLWIEAERGRFSCPPLGLDRELGNAGVEVLAIVHGTVRADIEHPDRPVDLGLRGGVETNGRKDGAPVNIVFDVHPSLALYALSKCAVGPALDDASMLLTFDAETARARVHARRDGSRLVADIDVDVAGVTGRLSIGDMEGLAAPEWSHAESASSGPGARERWSGAALRLARSALAAQWVGEDRTPIALLGLIGVQALMRPDTAPELGEPEAPRRFQVPLRPEASGGDVGVRRFGEQLAMAALASRAPGSWDGHLIRCIPLLSMPRSDGELAACGALLGQVAQDPARGPLGAWIAAEACASVGRHDWARAMATAGLADLSAAAFVADVGTLLGGPDGAARGAGSRRVVAAWRDLHRRALDEADPLFDGDERAAVRAIFGDAPSDDDRAVWATGLGALWNEFARSVIAGRLEVLAAE